MAIANWGTAVIFSVSEDKVFTFRNMNRTVGSSWATHSRIGLKDQVEFLRPNLQKLNLKLPLISITALTPGQLLSAWRGRRRWGKFTLS